MYEWLLCIYEWQVWMLTSTHHRRAEPDSRGPGARQRQSNEWSQTDCRQDIKLQTTQTIITHSVRAQRAVFFFPVQKVDCCCNDKQNWMFMKAHKLYAKDLFFLCNCATKHYVWVDKKINHQASQFLNKVTTYHQTVLGAVQCQTLSGIWCHL